MKGDDVRGMQPGVDATGTDLLIAEAAALWRAGRLDDATALAQGILALRPREHAALDLLGLVAFQRKEHEKAIDRFCQAIAIEGQVAAYHGNLGNAYLQSGRSGDAAGCFRQALALEPGATLAHFGLGLALLDQKVYAAAAEHLKEALDGRPDHADTHLNLGIALTELGRLDEAVAHCRRAVALDPSYAASHLRLGIALRAMGELQAAREEIGRAVELDPKSAVAHYQFAVTLKALDDPEGAERALKQALVLRPDMVEARRELDALSGNCSTGTVFRQLRATSAIRWPSREDEAAGDRLSRYMEAFLDKEQHPRMGTYPGLRAHPWHDAAGFPIVHALEQSYDAICREISALEKKWFHDEIEGMTRVGNWEVFLFYERGRKNRENCSHCPVISGIIEAHNTVRTLAGLMYASKTRPGTHIVPHHGPTNMRLRVHLGIKIPNGDCALRVGDEIRRWEEGKCLVFDDHFEHESWNYTKEPRTVLILDIWHPDLTATEVAFLEGLHRYAYYQAGSLNRYWNANAEARDRARKEYD